MPTPDPSAAVAHALAGPMGAFFWIFILIVVVLSLVVYWRIATKAGYAGALSLLMFVPFVNLVMLLIFAFSEWPLEKEIRTLRSSGGARIVST
ncbi:MAG: hypothetical protein NVS1B14_09060 [Vulcanimicrobiaceae bacterium]